MRLGNGKQDFESAGQFLKKARQDEALDSDIKLEFEADHNSTEIEADETEESTEKCDRIQPEGSTHKIEDQVEFIAKSQGVADKLNNWRNNKKKSGQEPTLKITLDEVEFQYGSPETAEFR